MRDELRPLEGQPAYFEARVLEWRDVEDGHRDFLLKGVKVWAWDGQSRVGQGSPIRLDHLWMRCKQGVYSESIELLSTVNGAGRVSWYRRAGDGSVDLGLRCGTEVVNLDVNAQILLCMLSVPGRALEHDEEALVRMKAQLALLDRAAATPDVLAYSYEHSHAELREIMRDTVAALTRIIEPTRARIDSGAAKGHKPTDLGLPLRNCKKKRRLTAAA